MARPRDVSFRIVARDFTRGAFRSIRRSVATIRASILNLNTLFAGLAGASFVAFGTRAARAARDVLTFSRAFGFTTTEAQALDIGLRRVGGTFEQAEDAFNAFVGRLTKIRDGTAEGARFLEVLQKLGFTQEEINDAFANPQEAFRRLAEIAGGPDFTRFQGFIQELTSEGGARSLRRFATVIGTLDDAVARFTAEGLIQTESALQQQAALANQLDAAYERLGQRTAQILVDNQEVLEGLLDAANAILNVLADADRIAADLKENAQFLPRTGEAIGENLFQLLNEPLNARQQAATIAAGPGAIALLALLRTIAQNTSDTADNVGRFQ